MRKGALHGPLGPSVSAYRTDYPAIRSAGPTGPLGKKAGAEFSGGPPSLPQEPSSSPWLAPSPVRSLGGAGTLA